MTPNVWTVVYNIHISIHEWVSFEYSEKYAQFPSFLK